MFVTPFRDPAVQAHFNTYPQSVRKRMMALRELAFGVAARTPGVGELYETLKWGEPAYVTANTKSGSTVRMNWKPKHPDQCAVYFHCQTGLVESFRLMFPNDFIFEGNRALVLKMADAFPKDELAFCMEASFTYHLRKRASLRSRAGQERKAGNDQASG